MNIVGVPLGHRSAVEYSFGEEHARDIVRIAAYRRFNCRTV
jgi:hypothetical protein